MKKTWKVYAGFLLLPEAVGLLAWLLTREGMARFAQTAVQPPLSPPPWVFGVVWVVLYALMGLGMARVTLSGKDPGRAQTFFLLQLIVNFFWSLFFFNAGQYGFSLLWLLILFLLILAMLLAFAKADKAAGALQIPYLLWVSFAAYLNYGVWQLNS